MTTRERLSFLVDVHVPLPFENALRSDGYAVTAIDADVWGPATARGRLCVDTSGPFAYFSPFDAASVPTSPRGATRFSIP